jgi:hypothetical protein
MATRSAMLVAMMLVACGSDVKVASPEMEEEDLCVEGGGEWTALDCSGAEDWCALNGCEAAFGKGCECPPDECWDGESCVAEPKPQR